MNTTKDNLISRNNSKEAMGSALNDTKDNVYENGDQLFGNLEGGTPVAVKDFDGRELADQEIKAEDIKETKSG